MQPTAETEAIRLDALRRVRELKNVRAALLPDADDPEVLSELTSIESQLVCAFRALR